MPPRQMADRPGHPHQGPIMAAQPIRRPTSSGDAG